MLKNEGGLRALRKGWKGVGKRASFAGFIDVAANWKRRGRRINQDGRRDKKWRKVRDRTLRPVLRTVAGAHPVGFIISKLLRL